MNGQRSRGPAPTGTMRATLHRPAVSLLAVVLALGLLAACGSTGRKAAGSQTSAGVSPTVSATGTGVPPSGSVTGAACGKVGVLLPDSTDPRWEQQDRPQL